MYLQSVAVQRTKRKTRTVEEGFKYKVNRDFKEEQEAESSVD